MDVGVQTRLTPENWLTLRAHSVNFALSSTVVPYSCRPQARVPTLAWQRFLPVLLRLHESHMTEVFPCNTQATDLLLAQGKATRKQNRASKQVFHEQLQRSWGRAHATCPITCLQRGFSFCHTPNSMQILAFVDQVLLTIDQLRWCGLSFHRVGQVHNVSTRNGHSHSCFRSNPLDIRKKETTQQNVAVLFCLCKSTDQHGPSRPDTLISAEGK